VAPDPIVLYAGIRAPLTALPGVSVFDGQVPAKVPADSAGFVLPYVAIYAGAGNDLEAERDSTGLVDTGVLDMPFQTTCVGASALTCLAVARDVRRALANHPVGAGFIKPAGFDTQVPIPDNQVTPARFYLPLQWRLTTT
jgi:hypothetical protein